MKSSKSCNRFSVITLGCKVNQYESETVIQQLKSAGWIPVQEGADVCIINTCTVTQKASMQSRQAIRHAIRSNPNARILVTGCYAQTEPDEISKIQGVHRIIGNTEKSQIPEVILSQASLFEFKFLTPARTRPYVKIQDGCDAFCTYCIVPYARGRSRSVPLDRVLKEIEHLKSSGYHEIVLTGIHLGCYGRDMSPPLRLIDLLHRIHDTNAMDRVRLSSLEPLEITADLIQFIARSGRVCRHFHIPLQSGDNEILHRMHRPYTGNFFKELVINIHQHIPDAAVGVDTLIGFPGETDQAFENTYSLIEQLPVTYLHVFPFSPRKGTPAYAFPDKVPSAAITSRCQKMRLLGNRKKNEFYTKFIGKTLQVLIENVRDNVTGLLKGMSSNYMPILVSGADELRNTLVEVRIEAVKDNNRVFGIAVS